MVEILLVFLTPGTIKYSDIKIGEILTQSVTELLSYVRYSDYPMMHCTTDLNKNFHT